MNYEDIHQRWVNIATSPFHDCVCVCEVTITNMAGVPNFEVMSENLMTLKLRFLRTYTIFIETI